MSSSVRMVVAAFVAMLALTTAFAPSRSMASTRMAKSAVKMAFENELGVLPPVGYWDPWGKFDLALF